MRQRERRSGKEASRETHESTARYVCVFPLRGGMLRLLISHLQKYQNATFRCNIFNLTVEQKNRKLI